MAALQRFNVVAIKPVPGTSKFAVVRVLEDSADNNRDY
jgi:hypothetical protein